MEHPARAGPPTPCPLHGDVLRRRGLVPDDVQHRRLARHQPGQGAEAERRFGHAHQFRQLRRVRLVECLYKLAGPAVSGWVWRRVGDVQYGRGRCHGAFYRDAARESTKGSATE